MSETAGKTTKRRWLRWVLISAGAILLCALLVGGYFYQRVSSTPVAWKAEQDRISKIAPSQKTAMAEGLRNRLINEWTSAEPSDEFRNASSDSLIGQRRRFEIPYDELNVWLDVEGRSLLEGLDIRLPASIQNAMVSGNEQGHLLFAVKQGSGNTGRVFTMAFEIEVADDGTITSELVSAYAGRLSISPDAATRLLTSASDTTDTGGDLLESLLSGKPVPPRDLPIDPGDNGFRDGRIVGLDIDQEQITVTRETIRRERENPSDN